MPLPEGPCFLDAETAAREATSPPVVNMSRSPSDDAAEHRGGVDGRLVVSELAHWNGRENQLADPDPDPWSTIPDGFSDAFAFARVL